MAVASDVRSTLTRTRYAATIHCRLGGRQAPLGGIQQLGQSQTQQIDEEYTIGRGFRGRPAALVPQNLTSRTLSLNRFDLFSEVFESTFGVNGEEWATIADMGATFEIYEIWKPPVPSLGLLATNAVNQVNSGAFDTVLTGIEGAVTLASPSVMYAYRGCRFTNFGRVIRVDNAIVNVDSSVIWRDRVKI